MASADQDPSETVKVIVGVDFGTTCTSVAWALASPTINNVDDQISVIKNWPAGGPESSGVPSEIAYNTARAISKGVKRKANGKKAYECQWGFDIATNLEPIRYTKLMLCSNDQYGNKLPGSIAIEDMWKVLSSCDRAPMEAISEYLSQVNKFAKENIIKTVTQHIAEFHYVFTIPAIWSDEARDATYIAAQQAGMGPSLRLVSEPEAAASYVLDIQNTQRDLVSGDLYIICDAGGGTIDVVTHEVVDLVPFKVREPVRGDGVLGGGVYVDNSFLNFLKDHIGETKFKELQSSPGILDLVLTSFSKSVKSNFPRPDLSNMNSYEITIPTLGNTRMKIKYKEVEALFKPHLDKAVELLEKQITAIGGKGQVRHICLVGGFGSSRYIFDGLVKHFKDISVKQAREPATAVARGAVLFAMHGSFLVSQKSRSHYGIIQRTSFDASKHSERDRSISKHDGEQAENQIGWFIRQGDDLLTATAVKRRFYETFDPQGSLPRDYEIEFVISEDEDPHDTYLPSSTTTTRRLCELTVDLSSLTNTCKRKQKPVPHRRLNFEISLLFSGRIIFHMTIDGQPFHHFSVKYVEEGSPS